MKITEIINTELKRKNTDDTFKDFDESDYVDTLGDLEKLSDTNKDINYGAYAKVVQNKDSFTVDKEEHDVLAHKKFEEPRDPYSVYIGKIAHNKLSEKNPYFPRVYKITRIFDKNGKIKYKYNLEKLFHIEEISNEELIEYGNRIFNKFNAILNTKKDPTTQALNFFKKNSSKYELQDEINELKIKIMYAYSDIMSDPNYSEIIKDKNLLKALNFIYDLAEMKDYVIDLHGKNFMFRRSAHGIQLVLTDPLSR